MSDTPNRFGILRIENEARFEYECTACTTYDRKNMVLVLLSSQSSVHLQSLRDTHLCASCSLIIIPMVPLFYHSVVDILYAVEYSHSPVHIFQICTP